MKISLFMLLLTACLCSCKNPDKKLHAENSQSQIGEQFTLSNIVDTSGELIELDFSRSELTLIDFWNNTCPPSVAEMNQFPDLINGKESKIDQEALWSIYKI